MRSVTLLASLFILSIDALADTWPDPARFQDAIDAFVETDRTNPPPKGAVVATGSSSMRGWHETIKDDLAPLTIIPRGFGGSNMNDVLAYVDELILRHEPSKVLIYEGDNDVSLGATPDEILDRLNEILKEIGESLPNTEVYLLYVKPSPSRWDLWPVMEVVNQRYQAICDARPDIHCIDVASPMLNENGKPKPEIFLEDDLHMNDKGYRLWTRAVRSVVFDEE